MRILCLVAAVICAASVVADDAATQAAKTAAGYVGEDVRALVDGAMSSSLPDMVIDDSASSHHSSGDSGAAAGTAAAARCRSKDAATDPKCVGVGLATHSESWGDRYPMTRQDKIFTSGVLSQDYKTNLGFDPDELASGVCQTLTITAAQASEQAFCVRDQSSQIPLKPPIAVTGSTNGPLSAKVDQESSGFWKFRLGSDEWLPGRGVMEIKLTITLDDLDAVGEARLLRMWFDDFAAASVNDNILFVGPWGGDRLDYDGRRVCWRGHRCTSRINLASAYDRWRPLGVDFNLIFVWEKTLSKRASCILAKVGSSWRDFYPLPMMQRSDWSSPNNWISCLRKRDARIWRHEAASNPLLRNACLRGLTVHQTPTRIPAPARMRKRLLIAAAPALSAPERIAHSQGKTPLHRATLCPPL